MAINLDGFAARFAADSDPWSTFSSRDEAIKREAIIHALGSNTRGRILELASGNGSNSAALAPRCLKLDATEGTAEGAALTARAIAHWPRARAHKLVLPGRSPQGTYDAIIIAELLYYLTPSQMRSVAAECDRLARHRTRLVLAHHTVDFFDFAQHAQRINERFVGCTAKFGSLRTQRRSRRWIVQYCDAR